MTKEKLKERIYTLYTMQGILLEIGYKDMNYDTFYDDLVNDILRSIEDNDYLMRSFGLLSREDCIIFITPRLYRLEDIIYIYNLSIKEYERKYKQGVN